MKIQALVLSIFLCCSSFSVLKKYAGEVHITPNAVVVANDSLYLDWIIDLREVVVPSGYSRVFIPMLRTGRQTLDLPSVVVAGERRKKADKRKRALRPEELVVPYAEIGYSKRHGSRLVYYKVALPYARWMTDAELVLRQVNRDCCSETLLSADVLATHVVPASDLLAPVLHETEVLAHASQPSSVLALPTTQLTVSTIHKEADVASLINSASAALVAGNVRLARAYLEQAGKDARTYNNWGVLYSLEENHVMAAIYFRKALRTEPAVAGENLKRLEGRL